MAADNDRAGTPPRHTVGTDGARPAHGTLVRREYGLLAPTGTTVDPADAGDSVSEAGHGVTGYQDGREPEEGDKTQKRTLPARGRNGIGDKGRGPPKRLRALNTCGHQGGERGGGPPAQQRAPMSISEGPGGAPQTL